MEMLPLAQPHSLSDVHLLELTAIVRGMSFLFTAVAEEGLLILPRWNFGGSKRLRSLWTWVRRLWFLSCLLVLLGRHFCLAHCGDLVGQPLLELDKVSILGILLEKALGPSNFQLGDHIVKQLLLMFDGYFLTLQTIDSIVEG
jgi:hypothetical protein